MAVPSISFLILAAISACLFNISSAILWRQTVLLVTNILFLASFAHHPAEVVPYAVFLAAGFGLIHLIRRGVPAAVYAGSIIVVLIAFFWLKQYTFLPKSIFLASPYLLVGLSYVFFRVLHLVIDARHPDDMPSMNLFDYLNFTLNFTSLTSGPIQRYEDYRRTTVEAPLELKFTDLGVGCERIATGFFKIMVVAVLLDVFQRHLASQILSGPSWTTRMLDGVGLAVLYPVYLYFNFSGYTDFVIGVARFFRIELPENFDRPFTAASFIEYWNRWHMSLSNWLKTYVYNPLMTTMMRRIKSPKFLPYASSVALFATFFLIGAWHGRTSKFLFFGLLNGFGVAVNQIYRIIMIKQMGRKRFTAFSGSPAYLFAGRGLTLAWVSFTLLWFWSDWPELLDFARAMGLSVIIAACIILPVCAAIVLAIWIAMRNSALSFIWRGRPLLNSRYVRTVWLSVMVTFLLAVQGVMNAAPPEIVYKDF
jgi:alginate O-acetyltransferase complex protein AlgI